MQAKPMMILIAIAALALTAAIGAGSASGGVRRSEITQPPFVCPPNTHPLMGIACRVEGNANPTNRSHLLRLRIARRYLSMLIVCRKPTAETIACRLTNLRTGTPPATGWRIVRLTLPADWTRVTFRCAANSKGFACHRKSSS